MRHISIFSLLAGIFGLLPALALTLAGCTPATGPVAAAANVAAIPVIHRTLTDAVYSAITGKDCSVVRLDEHKTYCRPPEPEPSAQPYCTRSLGVVDCWQDPASLPDHPPQVADGPGTLNAAQEANRTARWPPL